MASIVADQDPRCSFRREIGADFPQSASHRTAEGHTYRPPPLCSQEILSDSVPFDFVKAFEPVPNRFGAAARTEEDQGNLMGQVFGHGSL